MSAAIEDYINKNIIARIDTTPDTPISGRVFPVVSKHKTVLIFDLRPRNRLENRIHSPPLPTLQTIAHTLAMSPHFPIYMCRIDVFRFFDSLILPPNYCHPFYFQYESKTFEYRRLPFGWAAAPTIAQRFAENIVRNAIHNIKHDFAKVFVYLDDWLLASTCKETCSLMCARIVEYVQSFGLIINTEKSIMVPTTSLPMLGARFTAEQELIVRTIDTPLFRTLPTLLAHHLSVQRMKQIIGSLLWRDRSIAPYLTPLYQRIRHHRGGRLHPQEQLRLTAAASMAARSTLCSRRWFPLPRMTNVTPDSCLLLSDASASRRLAAVVVWPHGRFTRRRLPRSLYRTHALPQLCQQDAELFALYIALHIAIHTFPSRSVTLVADSASALWAAYRLTSHTPNPFRTRILCRIADVLRRHPTHHISLAYLPSALHPADPLTHTHYSLPAVRRRLTDLTTLYPLPGSQPPSALKRTCILSTRLLRKKKKVFFSC
jgi:hypothetical protein